MAETTAPAVGPLAALGPIGAIASMAELAFGGPSFSQQMQVFQQKLTQMTPQQVADARSRGFFGPTLSDITMARRALGAKIPKPLSHLTTSVPQAKPLVATAAPKEANVGFLSGLGKVFGGVTTAIGDVRGIVSAIHPAATAAGKAATVALDTAGSAAKTVAAAARAHPVMAAAAAGTAAAAGIAASTMGGGSAAGKTMAKAHLKNIAKGLGIHHRRMHVTNTKALHRALRRVKGFEHVARRVLRITMSKPHKVHFKFQRKRRAA